MITIWDWFAQLLGLYGTVEINGCSRGKNSKFHVLNKAMTHCFRRETPREIEPAMHRWHPPQKFVPALYDPKIVVGFVFGWSLQFKEEL